MPQNMPMNAKVFRLDERPVPGTLSVFIDNLVTGPWVHVRSRIFHEGVAGLGSKIRIESNLVDRFDSRAGERALVDMRIYADGAVILCYAQK